MYIVTEKKSGGEGEPRSRQSQVRCIVVLFVCSGQSEVHCISVLIVCRAQLDSFYSRQPTVRYLHGHSPGHLTSVTLPQYRQTGQGNDELMLNVLRCRLTY